MTEDILNSLGESEVLVHGLAIKPGKPTLLAKVQDKLIVGLPGHPISAIIVFKVLIEKFIKTHFYKNEEVAHKMKGIITENIKSAEGKETYHLVKLIEAEKNRYLAEPIHGKSGAISLLMEADGYVRTTISQEGMIQGEPVEINLFQ